MEKTLKIPYQFEIKLVMEKDNQPSQEQRLYLKKGASETFLHILLKILAYCYFWDENKIFTIEPNYKFRKFRPDLISFIPSEIPRELKEEVSKWVECKKVSIKKLVKLAKTLRRSEIYWFHTYGALRGALKGATVKKTLKSHKNLNLIGIKLDKNTLQSLTLDLGTKNPSWLLKQEENMLLISNGDWKKSIEFINDLQ